MRNGVSRCARSHDATRQRDAVKRRCSGRGTLRQTPDPVSFPACSPASFSACPPVRLQSMRFSGQLRSRSRQSPAEGGSGKPTEKGSFPFPAACPGLLLPPSRGHARHRRSPRERFPCATGCSASRSVSSPGPFPHISISRAVSSLLAPASPISPHFASNATQPQTAGTAPGAARSRPPAGSSGPGPPVSLAPNHH